MAHLRAVPDPDDDPQVEPGPTPSPSRSTPRRPWPRVRTTSPTPYDEGDDLAVEEEPRRYPSTIGGAFYLCILVVAGVALVIAARSDWRLGIQILGGSLLVAALLRLVLANRDAGMLAVRNRFLDAFLLIGCGVALIALASSIPDMPLT